LTKLVFAIFALAKNNICYKKSSNRFKVTKELLISIFLRVY